ncbi:MAG: hypothetical protein ACM3ZT_08860 [Bacillota bacterium]
MKFLPFRIPSLLHPGYKAFRAIAVCGLAFLPVACAVEDADKYIGKDPYIAFPEKYVVDQTTMPFPSGRRGVDWGMSLVWLGDHYLLTVDENTTPNHDPQVWKIVAIHDIPLLKAGQMIAMGSCLDDQKPVPWVVAVVQYDPTQQYFTDIRGAWIYDFHKVDIVDYPGTKLECLNPRYGLGEDQPPAVTTSVLPAAVPLMSPNPATVTAPAAATKPP